MRLWHGVDDEAQRGDELSHVGGRPLLPVGTPIPTCSATGTEMTFFFQLHLARSAQFESRVVSFFAVTDHVDDGAYLPKLPGSLPGAVLDSSFFAKVPSFYRIFCFDPTRAARVSAYRETVKYRRLRFDEPHGEGGVMFGHVGGAPDWILDDEAPYSFNGLASSVEFLFQTELDYEFETVPGAPRQQEQDYSVGGGGSCDSLLDTYDLFVANALYVFGLRDGAEERIYVVPQS